MELILHSLIAIFSAFRFTTLFTADSIWTPIRKRFKTVPWGCSLCMSVWAGIAALVLLFTLPWFNWPMAISWLWLSMNASNSNSKATEQPKMIKLELTIEEMNVIAAGLGKLPLETGLNVFMKLKEAAANVEKPKDEVVVD